LPALILTLLALLLVLWFMGQPYWTERQRRRLRAQPFPTEWRRIMQRRVPYVRAMPADLQLQLKQHMMVFLAEKAFLGCDGLEITDEIRVTVAAQACLLLLNRPGTYYPGLRQILVYAGSFVVNRVQTDAAGVHHHEPRALSGESWSEGQVILSWNDTLEGAANPSDGQNVTIHEFAHQLDQEKGVATGAPLLARRAHYARWSQVLGAEFSALQQRANQGTASLFSDYGATNPAEFFAVISEVFFEQPQRMSDEHPALYRELSQFYQLNPLSW
jgi:Mlc titration factor MtfA (ptsG expression regulator)